jgi:hypothetical protein
MNTAVSFLLMMAHISVCFGVSDDIPDEGLACAAMAVALPDLGYCMRIP